MRESAAAEVFYLLEYGSPLGILHLTFSDNGLLRLSLPGETRGAPPGRPLLSTESTSSQKLRVLTTKVTDQLDLFFGGYPVDFDVPLDLRGTPFQLSVWAETRQIPYRETRSYGEIARRLGRPGAARAVGAALGANPIPVIVPCHRVVGRDGALVGFGGGLELKRRLLEIESWRSVFPAFRSLAE